MVTVCPGIDCICVYDPETVTDGWRAPRACASCACAMVTSNDAART
jgi:hypothetical protein